MVAFTKHDLQFILDGIDVSEAHATATNTVTNNTWTVADLETSRQILLDLLPNSLEPIGMRTISGELNNLVIGQTEFGATGEFPRLLEPSFRDEADGEGIPLGPPLNDQFQPWQPGDTFLDSLDPSIPPGYRAGINYETNTDYNQPGNVVDSDPRTISNLIVDQTLDNPAAIYAAMIAAGVEGPDLTQGLIDIPAAVEAYETAVGSVQGLIDAQADAQAALVAAQTVEAQAAAANNAALATVAAYGNALAATGTASTAVVNLTTSAALLSSLLPPVGSTVDAADDAALLAAQTDASTAVSEVGAILTALQTGPGVSQADIDAAQAVLTAVQGTAALIDAIALGLVDDIADAGEILLAQISVLQAATNFGQLSDLSTQLGASEATAQTAQGVTAQALADATSDVTDAQADLNLANDNLAGAQATIDAAQANLDATLETYGVELNGDILVIPNLAPDEGLSAPFNSWMTLFGQFFDHGLDLVAKGGNGKVYIPLQPDDPIIAGDDGIFGTADDLPEFMRFMTVTRATVDADGIPGTADDQEAQNFTSPFVDQNQTYTSHPSHQIFVREYVDNGAGQPVATGHLIEGSAGGMATWGDVKDQARELLGVELTDAEALNIPLFAVDQYGEFIRGANGLPQFVIELQNAQGDVVGTTLVEGQLPANPGDSGLSLADAVALVQAAEDTAGSGLIAASSLTGFAFLLDIAHTAAPVFDATTGELLPDADDIAGNPIIPDARGNLPVYDNELLDAHFIAGDGRANENIGLTAVHHVFHQEHNRMVEHTKEVLLSNLNNNDLGTVGDLDGSAAALNLLNGYLLVPLTEFPADGTPVNDPSLVWDGDRLFQAAKFATEMQYQHLVFEEFARKVQPLVDLFASYETSIDASIVAEFAHVVYRFGHSMLNETVDVMDADGNLTEVGLIEAFLNPLGFHAGVQADGTVVGAPGDSTSAEIAGAIARGMTRQTGNAIDEFVTDALRDNLLGLPLDLPAINIARGRETGMPTLNEARAEFFAGTGDTKLKPYDSWFDFALHLKHGGASIANFVAAYGQHETILAEDTLLGKRAAALALTTGVQQIVTIDGVERIFDGPADRIAFLNSQNFAGGTDWSQTETGLNMVDFWIGGLAETTEPFGGMLGSTFNFVFEQQLEDLQDGDRFYYLGRVGGLNFLSQLEQNSFANMIIRNTDIGDNGADHLPGDIFATPAFILEVDQSRQVTGIENPNAPGVFNGDPVGDGASGGALNPFLDIGSNSLVIRDDPNTPGPDTNYLHYTGGDHVVLGGTEQNDTIIGGIGDDTLWGDGGDDNLEGGDGGDIILGGDGDDIITDIGGVNNLQGQDGNDAIFAGGGESLILAGSGKDFVLQGPDLAETFGGLGDDFIHAGDESSIVFGNEGDDWLEGGGGNNLMVGDNGDPFLNSTAGGNDVFISGLGDDDYDSEGGDDIMEGADGIQRFEGLNGFDWATYKDVDVGVTADMLLRAFDETPLPPSNVSIMDRFDSVEGLSGSRGGDILRGSNQTSVEISGLNNGNNSVLTNFDLIDGLRGADANETTANSDVLFNFDQTSWGEGDIILGGAGSDIIEGRAGNDIIDGDLKLDVALGWTARDAQGNVIATGRAAEMQGELMVETGALPAGITNLQEAVFSRVINPGDIQIIREIVREVTDADLANTPFDTAEFSDVQANYTIETDINGNIGDGDGDGFIRVSHDSAAGLNDGLGADGVDLVRNIERLSFADGSETISGSNAAAGGQPSFFLVEFDAQGTETGTVALTPPFDLEVGQTIRVTPDGITDGDGFAANPLFSHTWQFEEEPGSGVFVDFEITNVAGEIGPLTGATIEVPPEAEGLALRVKTSFLDGAGVIETVFSAPTNLVGSNVPGITLNGNGQANTLVGTEGADTINGRGGPDTIDGLGGADAITGGNGADVIDGGDGNDTIDGNGGGDTITGGAGNDTINGNGGADTIDGGDGNDIINGGGAADIIAGGAGDDTILGGNGADTIAGEEGNDTIDAGAGNDTIEWRARDIGRDVIDGGDNGNAGDTFDMRTNGDGDTLRIFAVVDPVDANAFAVEFPGETLAAGTEIVIAYDPGDGSGETIVAELQDIEELVINADAAAAGVDADGTNIVVSGNFDATSLNLNTITINGSVNNDSVDITGLTSDHRVILNSGGGNDSFIGQMRPQDQFNETSSSGTGGAALAFTIDDVVELKKLVLGIKSDKAEDFATGIRDLEGTGNNIANQDFGSADQPFIRLTDARYGALILEDDGNGNMVPVNREINPIFDGLDPREISNILGHQEPDTPTSSEEANIFFMAFGQYFDHGLDFLPKGGNGTIAIGGGNDDPADLTRGSIDSFDADNTPQHLNKTSPFVDQNQAYGSNELVGQFLRAGDGNGGLAAHLFSGKEDPSNPNFKLLPTLEELILEHWVNNTVFTGVPGGSGPDSTMSFREYFTDLPYEVSVNGAVQMHQGDLVSMVNGEYVINNDMIPFVNGNFMESGFTLVGDANPTINLLDHYVAGDLRANENYTLTSMHTIWARNHNYHVDGLEAAGFVGTAEELYQAAKIVNESEYQRVVFDEFADKLIGGLKGSGSHGFDDYNPAVDARISHEFAAAVYRVGHSLISQNIEIKDVHGNTISVPLTSAFLNPTNDDDAVKDGYLDYLPAVRPEGFEQRGVDGVLEGIIYQPAEEVDFNIVDAVRNDLVNIRADLFAFNVARGWDVGLGTMNQVRADLLASDDPYVKEAVERSGEDLTPYSSWEDFRDRNGLSAAVIAQFIAAYPDLAVAAADYPAFAEINGDIGEEQPDGSYIIKGIDRVDLWVGGLAEQHINGGMVGSTFWVVLHEQFDRLQEGDRFYYLNRVDDFDFYEQVEEQTFADIIARNTGIEGLPEDIFSVDARSDDDANDDNSGQDDDQADDGQDGQTNDDQTDDSNQNGDNTGSNSDSGQDSGTPTNDDSGNTNVPYVAPVVLTGDADSNTLVGNSNGDMLAGLDGDDALLAGDGDNVVYAGGGNDEIITGSGNDIALGGAGNDMIITGAGNDIIDAGLGSDIVLAGDGDDLVLARFNDGNDVYNGGAGNDTIDLSAITSDATIDLAIGRVESAQSGNDVASDFENAVGGQGNDLIIANGEVNVLTGGLGDDTFEFRSATAANNDRITDFEQGDSISLSGMFGGQDVTFMEGTTFAPGGQVVVYSSGDDAILEGDTNNDGNADFSITIVGRADLGDFN